MSHIFTPWYANTRFFLSFFHENPLALKYFCAALLSIPPDRISSFRLQSPFPQASEMKSCLCVTITCPQTFRLEIIPHAASSPLTGTSSHLFSLLPSTTPLIPGTPFLRIFLLTSPAHGFYLENPRTENVCTTRFLNLSSHLPPVLNSTLYDFARFLSLKQSSECSHFSRKFPSFSLFMPSIKEHLKEQEITSLFCETNHFSSAREIHFMCSLNRQLIREKRFDELREASENPECLLDFYKKYQTDGRF